MGATPHAQDLQVLDNGVLRIGVDRTYGGAITHLSRSGPGSPNLVNLYDMGRQVQQSYYAGPQPFGVPHPDWPDWPWNPIGAGDVYGNAAEVLLLDVAGERLHVRTRPLQWALDGVPGECVFDTTVELYGDLARVRCRLENDRPDRTSYPARHQELPALYTVGTLHRLVTYSGAEPFTGAATTTIENSGPPWAYWTAPESWAALVDDSGWGIGLVHPGALDFIGGFHGVPGAGGPHDPATGYVAPLQSEVLDHDIVYEYEYLLVLGDLARVRDVATKHRSDAPRTTEFSAGRRHWHPGDCTDRQVPGGREVTPRDGIGTWCSPTVWWPAGEVPRLVVEGLEEATSVHATWRVHGQAEPGSGQQVELERTATGRWSASPGWQDVVTGLVLSWDAAGPAVVRQVEVG